MRFIEFSSASGGQPLVVIDAREPSPESETRGQGPTDAASDAAGRQALLERGFLAALAR
jgi:hypothetical protein